MDIKLKMAPKLLSTTKNSLLTLFIGKYAKMVCGMKMAWKEKCLHERYCLWRLNSFIDIGVDMDRLEMNQATEAGGRMFIIKRQ